MSWFESIDHFIKKKKERHIARCSMVILTAAKHFVPEYADYVVGHLEDFYNNDHDLRIIADISAILCYIAIPGNRIHIFADIGRFTGSFYIIDTLGISDHRKAADLLTSFAYYYDNVMDALFSADQPFTAYNNPMYFAIKEILKQHDEINDTDFAKSSIAHADLSIITSEWITKMLPTITDLIKKQLRYLPAQ